MARAGYKKKALKRLRRGAGISFVFKTKRNTVVILSIIRTRFDFVNK